MSHHLLHCCFNPETIVAEYICAFFQLRGGTGTAVATSCLSLKIRITLISSTINIQWFHHLNAAYFLDILRTWEETRGEHKS